MTWYQTISTHSADQIYIWASLRQNCYIHSEQYLRLKLRFEKNWPSCLTHSGLVTPYGDIDLGQH